jgi:hypothetical protein
MFTYTVQFEYRKPDAPEFRQHRGDFVAKDARHAHDVVVEQLKMLGFIVGVVAVYGSEQLMYGAVLPKPFTPASAPHLFLPVVEEATHV